MSMLLRRHHKKDEPEVEEVVETKDLEELTVPELKELADDEEVEYKSNATKPQLIELLEGK